jgi:hypothetical protein
VFGLSTINAFLENGAPHSYILVASSGTLGHSLGYVPRLYSKVGIGLKFISYG